MAAQYQVLARKWRPQQFADVVGQEHVTTTLKNAIEQDRLAHAYLFVGPRGIGKTSIARIFAKALNCLKGPTATPCGKCDLCKEITDGRSMDVLEIDGASNNGVDQVRDLRDTCRYVPARAKFKIYIIDEVHMLSPAAFNALLKTLEEPPAHVKFVFATTEPQKVLPTILSRCQRFDLRRIPASLLGRRLKEIAKDEGVKIDDNALTAIARGAEGGMRDAESALDQLIAFCGDKITEENVLSVFGLVAHDQLAALTNAVIDGDTNTALRVLQELDGVGKDLQRLLADLLEHFRNLLVLTTAGDTSVALDLADTDLELLRAQAKRVDADTVLRMVDALTGAEARLRYALSKRIYFEIALIKAIKARDMVGLDGVLKKLNDLKNQMAAGGAVAVPLATRVPIVAETPAPAPARLRQADIPSAAQPAVDAAKPALSAAAVEEAWQYAVEHLGKVRPLAKSYLIGTRSLGLRGNVLVIGFDPEFADRREFMDTARNRELLQTKLKEQLHHDIGLKFEVNAAAALPTPAASVPVAVPASPAPSLTPASPRASESPAKKNLDDFKNDPLIKKALDIFKGTIVEVRK